jgi:glycine cleavage system H protein
VTIPADLRYTSDHEWVRVEGSSARIGITDFAQSALGDVVFVDLPDVGTELAAGDRLGEVESTKSVSEIYAPLAGRVAEVNSALGETPETLNRDPYGEGWICVIAVADPGAANDLLDAGAYESLTAQD